MSSTETRLDVRYHGRVGDFELDARFAAPLRGVTAVFGPSGAGKTLILRCIAGLTRLEGRLRVGSSEWDHSDAGLHRPPHARPIGYVFQEASLFDHLSVRDNLFYGHRRALRRAAVRIRPEDVVSLLGIEPLLERAPRGLSGGERQRVAIGRALLSQPELLLMDEPLAALDRSAKDEILPYFEAVQRSLAIPVLYVTHDLSEVERLADHLVLLERGRVVRSGRLGDVLAEPDTPLAVGPTAATVLEAEVCGFDPSDSMTTLTTAGETLLVPGPCGPPRARRRLHVAAQDVSLVLEKPLQTTILNVLPARIERIEPLDAGRANVVLELGSGAPPTRLLARITLRSARTLALEPGQYVYAQIKAASIVDATSGRDRDAPGFTS